MKATLFACLSMSMLSACAHSTAPNSPLDPDFAITPAKTTYSLGESVSAQLLNKSGKQVGYGACAVALERYDGRKWVHVWPTNGVCIDILYVLDANGSRTVSVPIEPKLAPGGYRLSILILPETKLPSRHVYSPTFRIQDAA